MILLPGPDTRTQTPLVWSDFQIKGYVYEDFVSLRLYIYLILTISEILEHIYEVLPKIEPDQCTIATGKVVVAKSSPL